MIGSDPRGDMGRLQGKLAHEELSATVGLYRLVFRGITAPVWLPFYLWRRYRQGRAWQEAMADYVRAQVEKGVDDPKKMALGWVKLHPDRYPLGEFDPALPKVEKGFKEILSRVRGQRRAW